MGKPLKLTGDVIETEARAAANAAKSALGSLFRLLVILGISYVILGPLIGILASSFFSDSDAYSPLVYIIPQQPTLERYSLAITRLDFFNVITKDLAYVLAITAIQVLVCSFVGYGFARFDFPFKNVLFGCVIVMIVIPTHSVMLPLYIAFRKFDPLGLMTLFAGGPINLLGTPAPVAIMSVLGCGLRSGVFIYIFNQFFRGLPKEIEEAAFVDGAGPFYTYFRIMLVNAAPSVLTVAIFSMVWQYNDTFMANLFNLSGNMILSKRITSLQATLGNLDRILDPGISQLYVYAGIVMMLMPIIIIYVVLQRQFIEGVERSGIVG
ncbi:MAG: carbohydrate ABC transporter permease [Clostridiales bacterium]|jgi:multiple sugar transport system permease protein|nr:carbohydrate ABC transporter permease [Clostridiales bacterium]MDR2749701.1 carbohydrate ABC transporter permease [Clostridiales bacterium]